MGPFDRAQWQVLSQNLQLARAADRDVDYAIDTTALLDIDRCRQLFDTVGPMIGSPSHVVTASLLAKRIAFLVTGPSLYALSAFDLGLNMARDNCITEYAHRDGSWQSRMVLKDLGVDRPVDGRRAEWRERVVQRVFADHLTPLWAAFHEACGIAPRILWENTAVRVFSLYERRLAKCDGERVRRQVQDDFDYLMHHASASVFGLPDHPLRRFFGTAVTRRGDGPPSGQARVPQRSGPPLGVPQPDTGVRYRKTCCLYFKATDPAEYCSTCPLIRPGVNKPV